MNILDNYLDNLSTGIIICKTLYNEKIKGNEYECVYANTAIMELLNKDLINVINKTLKEIFQQHYEKIYNILNEIELGNKPKEYTNFLGNKYINIKISKIEQQYILLELIDKTCEYNENIKIDNLEENINEGKAYLVLRDKMANIGQLSAGIAHEINNPLGFVISNFSTLKKYVNKFDKALEEYKNLYEKFVEEYNLKEEYLQNLYDIEKNNKIKFIQEDLKELFKDTEDGLERIRTIVAAFKKFSYQKEEDTFEEYDLNEGIKNTLIIAKNEIKYNSNVEMNLKEIPMIEANGNEINQVILNLIVNASQAIKEKKEINSQEFGLIKISTYSDEDYVYCEIEDNGIGISEENMKKIFTPFFTTKPMGKGTGLGLSISLKIIKVKHKGHIKIESIYNKGTKVTIKLPINLNLALKEAAPTREY